MICPTCNTHQMVHPKDSGPDGPFTMTCKGCKKTPDKCTCDYSIGVDLEALT